MSEIRVSYVRTVDPVQEPITLEEAKALLKVEHTAVYEQAMRDGPELDRGMDID